MNGRLGTGETVRIFPMSNWTEKDVWRYILREKLDVVPLYLAKDRPTILRNGQLLMQDDVRLQPKAGETVVLKVLRGKETLDLSVTLEAGGAGGR